MLKEVIIKQAGYLLIGLFVSMASLSSCGGSQSTNGAQEIYDSAVKLNSSGNYRESNTLLDSLSKAFPNEFDLIRQGIHLRTLNEEGYNIAEQTKNDSVLNAVKPVANRLSGQFKFIKEPDMVEGFWIHKLINRNAQMTSLEPRINENGEVFLVSNYVGKSIKHTSLRARCASGEAITASVPYDKARNYRYENDGLRYESITFRPEECADFMSFISSNSNSKITVYFCGSSKAPISLSKANITAFKETYDYAQAASALKKAEAKKIYLAKKLEITKKQQAKTMTK